MIMEFQSTSQLSNATSYRGIWGKLRKRERDHLLEEISSFGIKLKTWDDHQWDSTVSVTRRKVFRLLYEILVVCTHIFIGSNNSGSMEQHYAIMYMAKAKNTRPSIVSEKEGPHVCHHNYYNIYTQNQFLTCSRQINV